MDSSVSLFNVKKNKAVWLKEELPTAFGNRHPIRKEVKGYVTSEGFVAGMLHVQFYTHMHGTENVRFNELSAAKYLVTDVW